MNKQSDGTEVRKKKQGKKRKKESLKEKKKEDEQPERYRRSEKKKQIDTQTNIQTINIDICSFSPVHNHFSLPFCPKMGFNLPKIGSEQRTKTEE